MSMARWPTPKARTVRRSIRPLPRWARDWFWDEALYTRLLEISGGKERILHYWRELQPDLKDINGAGVPDTVERLHAIKTAAYERAVQDGAMALRPGVLELIRAANRQGLRLAIATTTSPVNIAALLRKAIGPDWRQYFMVIEDASTALRKKPASAGVPANPQAPATASHRVPGVRRLGQWPEGRPRGRSGHPHCAQPLHGAPRFHRCAARFAQSARHHVGAVERLASSPCIIPSLSERHDTNPAPCPFHPVGRLCPPG